MAALPTSTEQWLVLVILLICIWLDMHSVVWEYLSTLLYGNISSSNCFSIAVCTALYGNICSAVLYGNIFSSNYSIFIRLCVQCYSYENSLSLWGCWPPGSDSSCIFLYLARETCAHCWGYKLLLLLRVGERREGGRMTSPFHLSISSLPSFLHPLIL